jgi:hypothetical protein
MLLYLCHYPAACSNSLYCFKHHWVLSRVPILSCSSVVLTHLLFAQCMH